MRVAVGRGAGEVTKARRGWQKRKERLRCCARVVEYRSWGHNSKRESQQLQRATEEAKSVLSESEQLATEQTRRELLEQCLTDDADASAKESANANRGRIAAAETFNREQQLSAFIAEHGVSNDRASYLANTLIRNDSPYCDIDTLDAKLRRLRRVLPGVNVPKLASRDANVLSLPANSAVSRIEELTQVFSFSKLDKVLLETPSLLYLDDFQNKVATCGQAIQSFYPTVSWRGVRRALEEEPSLLIDLPQVTVTSWVQADFAELPMSTQERLPQCILLCLPNCKGLY